MRKTKFFKKVTKVVAMSLLMVSMLGENALAATLISPVYCMHNWVRTGNQNISSWSYTHAANTGEGSCFVYCWVSTEYPQCTKCGKRGAEIPTEHVRHEYCVRLDK